MATTLATRAATIRLPMIELAAAAGRNVETVRLALRGDSDSRGSTLSAIEGALVAEELFLLRYLANLHKIAVLGVPDCAPPPWRAQITQEAAE